jgi:hypothetical protein
MERFSGFLKGVFIPVKKARQHPAGKCFQHWIITQTMATTLWIATLVWGKERTFSLISQS